MTKRYFYTDALAAAYMARHHGLKLNYTIKNILAHAIGDTEDFKSPYFIDPESLHLLEPREADLYACDTTCGWLATTPAESWKKQVGHFRIIQRNGIAFMWPESEE